MPIDAIAKRSNLQSIYQGVKDDFVAVNQLIAQSLHSDIELIRLIGKRIINSGGKRLRPLLVLLCAKLFNYPGQEHIRLATIIEFVHTATLLHDDVVDASELRRGQKTANVVWGNQASVLVGDFLYSRAFQMIAPLNNAAVMETLAFATNQLAEGEVMQLINRNKTNITEENYMEVIRRKTAMLFSAAAEIGAIIAKVNHTQQQALAKFGLHLGNAFQIIDDLLDYSANPELMGKNIGDDLAEGKSTLPLIYVMQHGNAKQRKLMTQAITHQDTNKLTEIIETIKITGALDYTQKRAKQQIELAKQQLTVIPNNHYREALTELADFAITRGY